MLIDTHCHVLSLEYKDIDVIIEKIRLSKVDKIIINGYDLKSSIEAVELANKHAFIYAAVGIGPENVTDASNQDIIEIASLAKNKKVVAIGEIGLDYYWTKENTDKQKEVFNKMLQIAIDFELPVIIHNRNATKDVYEMVKKSRVTGVLHCFSGSIESANDFIKIGFLIGIGGIVTFKNAKKLKEVIENVDISNLVLETDSPYLTPEPYRGTKNSPVYIEFIANEIANIKQLSKEKVISITGSNACHKFDL
ncbi:MAG: TatD family hydrolase [Bacilli bacterium]